ncbi:MAG: teicoplanin resistance protein VanZ [Roseateles depolymerans]|uniref:Teicoplanin resistance protein VanZ n=1 Tax=Roseateles depolymerans TaxID=76731 RepID=A0A2W5FGJ2_9BURK|nr:MAG: teicoplanin resistance protein VanZ [Roseateles depolymerans]
MLRRQSSATWLMLAHVGLILYASLYPFWPWRWPPGMGWPWLLGLPWPQRFWSFDVEANLVGYVPLGLLGYAAAVRSGWGRAAGLALGLLPGPLLSFLMETLQFFLPGRVPSLSDWALNSAGSTLGLLIGLALHAVGGLRHWEDLRDHWFGASSAPALALLALWPLALLYPTPLPFGLGQWLPWWRSTLVDALEGTPWALSWGTNVIQEHELPPGLEALSITLGLLAPMLLALTVARPGLRRVALIFGGLGLGLLGTATSTAMNIGPDHAWAWLTDATRPGVALGMALALLACLLPSRVCAAIGALSLCALIAIISLAPGDPYLALNVQAWEHGRFVNFYGLTRWLAWTWPFVALAWLLARLVQRSE